MVENEAKLSRAANCQLRNVIDINRNPYSYHTFMFPFLWKCSDNDLNPTKGSKLKIPKNQELLDFLNSDNSYWEPYQSPLFSNIESWKDLSSNAKEQIRLDYSVYQYFNFPARKAIYGDIEEDALKPKKKVRNYTYKFKDKAQNGTSHNIYSIIVSTGKDNQYYNYDLNINNITLRLYDPIGIGVIVYELENYEYCSLKDVIQINEYGRRIQLAMMAPDVSSGKKYLTAARLCIQGTHLGVINQDFEAEVFEHAISKAKYPWNKNKLNMVSRTVTDLFKDKSQNLKVSFDEKDNDRFYLMPYVDDRMFCMSLVSDPEIYPYGSIKYKGIESLGDDDALKTLYEFVFIDQYGDCTCQSPPMRKEMLEKALYLRWVEYGSIYGINRYSMVAITGSHEDTAATVIYPFLMIYKEMVQLVLVQRAAIGMFAERAMEISRIASENKLIKNYIIELQQDYVSFKNQILLFEVTAQQQGLEMYDMMRDSMNIELQKTEIEEQLRILFEISEMQSSDATNSVLNIFTVFGLLFVGLQVIQQQFAEKTDFNNILFLIFGVVFIVFIWIMRRHLKAPKKIVGKNKIEFCMLFLTTVGMVILIASQFF